ncbi:hypothetical protein [Zoogloea dura]|uniref:Uncharacterized protein n=1 Tax=Zoogloea dura TaxID=2728840 RepID=A0A848GDU7_9RHOO|nr:hypothetical protein [Zoogloea dura]NML28955.1 hypothetical protein [Zoogloea dura]
MIVISALLANIIDAGTDALTLAEDMDEATFRRSRLARSEISRLVGVIATNLADLPDAQRQQFAEIDWSAWSALTPQLQHDGPERDEALWFATRALVPATLMWLRVYKEGAPGLFEFQGR